MSTPIAQILRDAKVYKILEGAVEHHEDDPRGRCTGVEKADR
ncbi:MAG: hypothetical protein ABSF90_20590 [Syntrophobacteraceae bacterium]